MYEALPKFNYPSITGLPAHSCDLIVDAMQMGRTSPRSVSAWLALDDEIDILASEVEINAAIRWCARVGEAIEKIGEAQYELMLINEKGSALSSLWTVDQILKEVLDMPAWKSLLFMAAFNGEMDEAIDWLSDRMDEAMFKRNWKYEAADD